MDKIEEVTLKAIEADDRGEGRKVLLPKPDESLLIIKGTEHPEERIPFYQPKPDGMDKPTYLRAAIEDWKAERISLQRLFEIWRVNLYAAYNVLCSEELQTGRWKWVNIPTERVEEILEGLK